MAALRTTLGCDHAGLANLTAKEKQKCRDRLAGVGREPGPPAPLGLNAGAREAFDLAVTESHTAHMATVGCRATFGGGTLAWEHPSHGVKLGALPCYVVPPSAVFLRAKPPAAGF